MTATAGVATVIAKKHKQCNDSLNLWCLSFGVNEWCVVSIEDLMHYNAEMALSLLRRSQSNRQSSDDNNGKFLPVRVDRRNGRVNNIDSTKKMI